MALYRKKPVVITAITFDELVSHGALSGAPCQNGMPWSFSYGGHAITHENDDCYLIPTLEGTMRFERGDMLITGVKGEIYPCKADIFAATYDPAGPSALADIAAERQRQIDVEGWSPEHDDEHGPSDLALAAAAYAEASTLYEDPPEGDRPPQTWPFERAWFKPQGARRDLVRAGALVAAQIERIDRAEGR